jgi:dephospho-CoA kinase
MDAAFDATIAVIAPESLREERAVARGHASLAERAGRQLSQDEKAARANFTVRNDGSIADLQAALADVLAKLDDLP